MEILSKQLQGRAKQLGISNAEAARRVGLDERRYAHYASGRREPDLATLVRIAAALGTTPNWLLGINAAPNEDPQVSALLDRFANAASGMTLQDLELCVIQAEAVVAADRNKRSKNGS
ncbi:helix-turn-helix domain-containing protein [Pseudorhizobium tarimense]|uniref:helix-turn-helix domain-containing protein n=1 Tax=Pseudorhizobium tarimense TaxID=1079109 RepID=UPI001FF3818F|nr:helix-turn-helix transcriptional regulator [Pseudorhizobium tarimense]MCJ8519717.1 helix-turn-helix domain-containing protein [Pseudorhizobium tarimense]